MLSNEMMWVAFSCIIILFLVIDLVAFNKKKEAVNFKGAVLWSLFWISIALIFNGFILYEMGNRAASDFFTAYIVEKSLSVDNLFVFIIIFNYFKIPNKYQHKILFYGILGALILRMIFIFAGIAIIHQFEWVMYVFGAMLIYSGYKILKEEDKEIDPDKNFMLKIVKKFIGFTNDFNGGKFFSRENGKLVATPLFVALIVIETSDLIFAVDSIPAVLAITQDRFIAYTSNIMAILGLRALYFVISGIMDKFRFLNYGLSAILIFVGAKMLIKEFYAVPAFLSLLIILLILIISIAASSIIKEKSEEKSEEK